MHKGGLSKTIDTYKPRRISESCTVQKRESGECPDEDSLETDSDSRRHPHGYKCPNVASNLLCRLGRGRVRLHKEGLNSKYSSH